MWLVHGCVHVQYMCATCLLRVLLCVYDMRTTCVLPTCQYMSISYVQLVYHLATTCVLRLPGASLAFQGGESHVWRPVCLASQWRTVVPTRTLGACQLQVPGSGSCLNRRRTVIAAPAPVYALDQRASAASRRASASGQRVPTKGDHSSLAAVVSYAHGRWANELRIDGS